MHGQALDKTGRRKLADSTRFLKSLVAAPRLTGAVAPSGRALARAMATATGLPSHGLIVELGPGTGPVTRSLIEVGVDPQSARADRIRPGILPTSEAAFRVSCSHRGGRLRPSAHACAILRPTDRGGRLQFAPPKPAAAAADKADRRRLCADGAHGNVRPIHLRSPFANSSRGLRRALFGGSLAPDPAQSAAGICLDLSSQE